MDKMQYSEEMEDRLRVLESYIGTLTFPPPSTYEASLQQEQANLTAQQIKSQVVEALALLNLLRTSTDSSWEMIKQDLDSRWQEITKLKKIFD